MKNNPFPAPKYVCKPTEKIHSGESFNRCMKVYCGEKSVAIIVFIINVDIPPEVRANLMNGWNNLAKLKEYCNNSGMAWFTCAKE